MPNMPNMANPPDRRWLYAILLLAFALRLPAVPWLSVHHPDESYQYLEQAHRWLFGYGIVPWEYRYGIRSWLMPLLVAAPMKLGMMIAPMSDLPIILPRLMMVLASLAVVVAGWMLGARLSRTHAIVAAFAAAVWIDLVYYAPHVLTEAAATACILPAAALLADRARRSDRRIALAGLLLGLGFIFRFHYAPAIAIIALAGCGLSFRAAWAPLILGGIAALLLSAGVDLAMGQMPFAWLIENIRQNIVHDRAALYGVTPPETYFLVIAASWQLWTGLVLVAAAIGARRYPALAAAAAAIIVMHMMIGHKEHRFILFAIATIILLAAIGSADAAAMLRGRRRRIGPALLIGLWAMASASIAWTTKPFASDAVPPAVHAAFATLRTDPRLCGLALDDLAFSQTGGYAVLRRPVPIFQYPDRATLLAERDRFDAMIGPLPAPPGFRATLCRDGRCLFRRPGPCAATPSRFEINRLLIAHDS
jgi:phosphatidylinositol glycan class B